MILHTRDVMLRNMEHARSQAEVFYAKQIMQQVIGCTWTEALRIARERIAQEWQR
jgi:hypothetical protein